MGFPGDSVEENLPANVRRCGLNPWVRKISLEKEMATYSSALAWEIPWTEEPAAAAAAAKSLQSCPTLCNPRQQPTRLPCPWDSPGKNTGVGCHFLLQCMKMKTEK